jgi:hypothetical protein
VSKVACGVKLLQQQLLLALEVHDVEVDIRFCLLDLGLHVAVAGLQRKQIIARIANLRLGAIQR